jgi:hypothetical protein
MSDDQSKINAETERRLLCLENCVQNLMDWQKRQNGTLQALDGKMDSLLLREASRDGAVKALKWVAVFLGATGIANLIAAFVR